MSRRQTLGALSPSQLNARPGASGAASRVATTAGKEGASATGMKPGRMSMAPDKAAMLLMANGANMYGGSIGGGSIGAGTGPGAGPSASMGATGMGPDPRRSSAFGNPAKAAASGGGPKADPRPLSDRGFQAACIRTLITYLSTHGYPAAIAPKTLTSPTVKDFTAVVQFLQQQFDPNMKVFGKIEDDVPAFFKRLNYPFQISKSALFAVGSPHSWPAVLAALTWLVELLNYNERLEAAGQGAAAGAGDAGAGVLDDPEAATKRRFYDYICTSYRYFLAGDDARCMAVDQEMLSAFEDKQQAATDAHAQLRKANEGVVAEVVRLTGEPSPLEAAQQRLAERSGDAEKFRQLIENLQGMKSSLQRKVAERQEEVTARREALAAVAQDNATLRAVIAAQPMNKADLARMVMERNKQKEVLEAVSAHCEDLQDKLHGQEVQLVAVLKSLEASVSRYNQVAHRLKLVPASTKRAGGITYELRINREAASAGDFANIDLKGVIKPGLDHLVEGYRSKAAQLGRDLLGLRESAAGVAESIRERTEENRALEAMIAKLEAQLQVQREAHEERVRGLAARAEALQGDVATRRSEAHVHAAAVEARKHAVQAELDALQRHCSTEITRLRVELRSALELMLQHRMHVQQVVSGTKATVMQAYRDVQAAPIVQV